MSRLKYALIGHGRRGAGHLSTAATLKDSFEVVAVCDAHQESAEAGAAKVGTKAYTDVRKMLDETSPDVCDVVVPVSLHHIVSCYLSRRGISHNVETGLAPTLGLMDMMIADAAENGVKLQTSENFPFVPVEQFVCKLIKEGVIGNVHKCHRLFSTTGYHGLAAIRCRMDANPKAVSSIGHTMPVTPYVDRAKRDFNRENLEFYAIDFDDGGLGIAMVGNKNGCLGRNKLVGFETCGERGTIITNGNQGATGGETVNVCTDEDLRNGGRAQTYEFQREYSDSGTLQRIFVELPASLGGTVAWVNPYRQTDISETGISLATMLDGIARAVREDTQPLWTGEMGRADQEMVIAAHRSIRMNRQPIQLPLEPDPAEEDAFDRDFEAQFGVHPREDIEKALQVNFKAR
ncbi:Gfo/Idh/MocA family oxidoreductase [Candidatus Poribacteria bacterium]|nr:Gfo/Idh/MocA family oxidoreductase [Candidatus Poribacteria bacterium]MYH82566.1 Gfo/Idh/MocA family oxidoreductase [Candidatus Poribacteria bacterium]MYK94977.1 Gfo/Idh/MocA family oxidoreductase [Candidatus Poribacteria bacterium]